MTGRARSGRAIGAIIAMAAGIAVAGCIGQVSAHPIGRPASDARPIAGAAPDEHSVVPVAPVPDDRDLDRIDRAATLAASVPAAIEEAPPFVCEIMDMDTGATDDTPATDKTSRLLAIGP